MSSMQLSPEPPPMATERYRPARNHCAGVVTCGNGSLATPHGTAAALKAEAPQPAYGPDAAPVSWWHVIQRSNRKAANRRKARRGWR